MPQTTNKKWCWVATETAKGWRLKLAIGDRDYNLKGLLLKDYVAIQAIIGSPHKIIYLPLKD